MPANVFILAKRLYYGLRVSDIKTSSVLNNDLSETKCNTVVMYLPN